VLDEATVSMNLLSFRVKSFGYERSFGIGRSTYALFQRTETESESKLRPRLLRLWVVVPTEWLIFDEAADSLVIGQDGETPGPQAKGTALEAAADAEEFAEQGVSWKRRSFPGQQIVYVPVPRAQELFAAEGLAALDLK
jgi:hypothetical protein